MARSPHTAYLTVWMIPATVFLSDFLARTIKTKVQI